MNHSLSPSPSLTYTLQQRELLIHKSPHWLHWSCFVKATPVSHVKPCKRCSFAVSSFFSSSSSSYSSSPFLLSLLTIATAFSGIRIHRLSLSLSLTPCARFVAVICPLQFIATHTHCDTSEELWLLLKCNNSHWRTERRLFTSCAKKRREREKTLWLTWQGVLYDVHLSPGPFASESLLCYCTIIPPHTHHWTLTLTQVTLCHL